MENRLWYTTPPKEWMEGLPIGNGRLAAMVWGDGATDRLTLNHEWLWRGVNRFRDNEKVSEHLEEVRTLLRQGDFLQATEQANRWFGGAGGVSGRRNRVDPYQPAGELLFTPEGPAEFARRELDIVSAVATAERAVPDGAIVSTFIAHPGVQMILCRWEARGGRFSGRLRYQRVPDPGARERCEYDSGGIRYDCAFEGGLAFRVAVTLRSDGTLLPDAEGITVRDATVLTAYIDIGTDVKGINAELAAHPVPEDGWAALLESHKQIFSELLGRVALRAAVPGSDLPTDRRVAQVRAGGEDPALPLLYFNMGRYLLAASSVAGELPANLQGKWNDRIDPPWECDYHFDINLQMNYWVAEAAAMPECAEALIQYLERFLPHGKKAAADLYGCRGVWLPIQTDLWGRATPESCGWAVWVGAAPWMAQHVWRHYAYNGDRDYLARRAYPFLKEVALFFEDYLVEDARGTLQVLPSQSPENRFEGTGKWPVSFGVSAAMDVQLIYDALGYAIAAAEALDTDGEDRRRWQDMRDRLPPFAVGGDGRLLEWDVERPEVEPGHRHMSHLYGLHPSDLFHPDERPAQYEAAARSLDFRLAQGGGHTGWSRAWTACFMARLGRGEEAWRHLCALITDFATASLLDLHPPRIFQIDGNLGGAEAVLQCLAQAWGGKIYLLRALPPAWPEGSLSGVRMPGGHRLSLVWRAGELTSVEIEMGWSGSLTLAGLAGCFPLPAGASAQGLDVCVAAAPGSVIRLGEAEKE